LSVKLIPEANLLNSDSEELETGSHAIQFSRHDQRPAAPDQGNVILWEFAIVSRSIFRPPGVLNFGGGKSAVCFCLESLSCLAVPIVNLHEKTSKSARLSLGSAGMRNCGF
jgi:hypothetical protein